MADGQVLLPLHKLVLCLEWLPTPSLLDAEVCCQELRMLSWGSGLFPQLHLNELNFWGIFSASARMAGEACIPMHRAS